MVKKTIGFILALLLIPMTANALAAGTDVVPNAAPSTAETRPDVFTISAVYSVQMIDTASQKNFIQTIHEETFKRARIPMEVIYFPADEAIQAASDGLVDGAQNRVWEIGELYPSLVRVPEPNMIMHFVGFSHNASIRLNGWNSLRNHTVGYIKGWKIIEQHLQDEPNAIAVAHPRELYSMLDKGRIDIAIHSRMYGLKVIKDMELNGIHILSKPLVKRPMYLYIHETRKDLLPAITKALKSLKEDGTHARMTQSALKRLTQ